jgi:hypothetical protein
VTPVKAVPFLKKNRFKIGNYGIGQTKKAQETGNRIQKSRVEISLAAQNDLGPRPNS